MGSDGGSDRLGGGYRKTGSGSVIFSLCEENNLLSPHQTTLNQTILEDDRRSGFSAEDEG
eukprot:CAMPEP_0177255584 /NCGR_PEP_ID=MMETSP0367-20130122/56448_1 /TAXON_ID=447022 ORGANISM="Scrippsiella hangoei-like, Strain SHHI-4" /NCGR_SAMPLE_ID=MMETSP0367 /ASSEMBLY_ACC=CAM_ASM_000362 /LENGTH=59 /DNA_ID=CAMNT_0018709335 /DNA_START=27 /DNA_END=202 /DNA_ORIENTATION=-